MYSLVNYTRATSAEVVCTFCSVSLPKLNVDVKHLLARLEGETGSCAVTQTRGGHSKCDINANNTSYDKRLPRSGQTASGAGVPWRGAGAGAGGARRLFTALF
ncbi:hypothetical protein EVAR_77689_1 [Eumeta japonica]|uniref:Uncharacterized protein n=1 Tax=Eumeta variegata TaxID=151549 RepID=A0A4C1S982_EUMVA|nr:hypothetical protein EVAR_77689_1 [Eumeta japonica]